MMNCGAISIVITVVFILCGCATSQRDWETASRRNTIAEYQTYIRAHADAQYADIARQRIQRLKFEQAQNAHTESVLEAFIREYPSGALSEQARELLEAMALSAADRVNSVPAYEKFLSRFPDGRSASKVEQKVRALSYEAAVKGRTVALYEQFLTRYPQGDDSAELQKRLSDIRRWEEVKVLGDIIVRMAPKSQMSMSMDLVGGPRVGPIETFKSPTYKQDLDELRARLDAGANPNMVRIADFELPGTKPVPGNPNLVLQSLGNSGKPVPAAEGGMSLLEYCKINKLDEAYKVLLAHGAK